jgi:hypothetical protein
MLNLITARAERPLVPVAHILGIASDHVIPVQMEVCNVPEFAGPARPAGERQQQQHRPLPKHCA